MIKHLEMSDQTCFDCEKPIKKSVADKSKSEKPIQCYDCGRTIGSRSGQKRIRRTAREIRKDPSLRSIKREHLLLRNTHPHCTCYLNPLNCLVHNYIDPY